MGKVKQRNERRTAIVNKAVAAWDASGKEYTCLAVIYDVIRPIIYFECLAADDYYIRPRQCMNLAANIIHRRKYPNH